MNSYDNGEQLVELRPTGVTARWQRWAILALSMTALGVSLFLAWSTIKVGSIAGCGTAGIFDCHHVLQSKWSKWMGIPVSIPAALLHLTLISCVLMSLASVVRRHAHLSNFVDGAITLLATCAALAGAWFMSLQIFSIGKICQYCLIAHSAGIILFAIVIGTRELRHTQLPRLGLVAALLTFGLVIGQVYGPEPETSTVEVHSQADDLEFASVDFDEVDFDVEAEETLAVEDLEIELPAENEPTYTSNAIAAVVDVSNDAVTAPQKPEQTVSKFEDTPVVSVDRALAASPIATPTAVPPETDDNGQPKPEQPLELDNVDDKEMDATSPVPTYSPLPQDDESTPQAADDEPPRVLAIPGAKTKLKIEQWPMIGSPEADVVLVELFDYTCSHCRDMNRQLEEARHRYGDKLALVVLPVPLNSSCNPTVSVTNPSHADACELAHIALAVWRVDEAAFPDFHNWLCSSTGRTAGEARMEAERRVDPNSLRRQISGKTVPKYLAQHVSIYRKAGEGTLPKVFSERITVNGRTSSTDSLCATIQSQHGISAP